MPLPSLSESSSLMGFLLKRDFIALGEMVDR